MLKWVGNAAHIDAPEFAKNRLCLVLLDAGRTITLQLLKEKTSLTESDFERLKLMQEPIIKGTDFAKEKGVVF
jgi:hypothetical protein